MGHFSGSGFRRVGLHINPEAGIASPSVDRQAAPATNVDMQGNRILIGPSFSTGRNAAFPVLVNSRFCEESRLKDALDN